MTCFVDTSALLAVLDRDDDHHPAAEGIWKDLMEKRSVLVTTNYVVLETLAILQSRIGLDAVRRFHDDICPVLTIDWISGERHEKGVSAVLAAARRRLSLVDCISFDTMRERGIRKAFAFDAHFPEQGFKALV